MTPSDASMSLLPLAGLTLRVALVVLAGWYGALVARRLVALAAERTGLEAQAERLGVARLLYGAGWHGGLSKLLGEVARGIVLLVAASLLADSLGFPGLAEGVGVLVAFLPRAATALAILLGGWLGAEWLKKLLVGVAKRRGVSSPDFLGEVVYWLALVIVGALAAEQLGLETSLVNQLLVIGVGSACLGVAASLAWGGGPIARNLLSRHYAQQMFDVGDHLEGTGYAGTVVAFGSVGILLLDGDDRELLVPYARVLDDTVWLRRIESRHDSAAEE